MSVASIVLSGEKVSGFIHKVFPCNVEVRSSEAKGNLPLH